MKANKGRTKDSKINTTARLSSGSASTEHLNGNLPQSDADLIFAYKRRNKSSLLATNMIQVSVLEGNSERQKELAQKLTSLGLSFDEVACLLFDLNIKN